MQYIKIVSKRSISYSCRKLSSKKKGDFTLLYTTYFIKAKGSRPKVFCSKGVLRNFTKFTGKHLWQSLFLIKLQGSARKNSGTGVFL